MKTKTIKINQENIVNLELTREESIRLLAIAVSGEILEFGVDYDHICSQYYHILETIATVLLEFEEGYIPLKYRQSEDLLADHNYITVHSLKEVDPRTIGGNFIVTCTSRVCQIPLLGRTEGTELGKVILDKVEHLVNLYRDRLLGTLEKSYFTKGGDYTELFKSLDTKINAMNYTLKTIILEETKETSSDPTQDNTDYKQYETFIKLKDAIVRSHRLSVITPHTGVIKAMIARILNYVDAVVDNVVVFDEIEVSNREMNIMTDSIYNDLRFICLITSNPWIVQEPLPVIEEKIADHVDSHMDMITETLSDSSNIKSRAIFESYNQLLRVLSCKSATNFRLTRQYIISLYSSFDNLKFHIAMTKLHLIKNNLL